MDHLLKKKNWICHNLFFTIRSHVKLATGHNSAIINDTKIIRFKSALGSNQNLSPIIKKKRWNMILPDMTPIKVEIFSLDKKFFFFFLAYHAFYLLSNHQILCKLMKVRPPITITSVNSDEIDEQLNAFIIPSNSNAKSSFLSSPSLKI